MRLIQCNKTNESIKPPNQNMLPKEIRLTLEQQMLLGYDREIYHDLCNTSLDPVLIDTRDLTLELINKLIDMHKHKF